MTIDNFLSRPDIRVNRAVRIGQILRHEAAAPPAIAEIAARSRTVVLRDGSTALIRQVQAAVALAHGCPVLQQGGSLEVGEIVPA